MTVVMPPISIPAFLFRPRQKEPIKMPELPSDFPERAKALEEAQNNYYSKLEDFENSLSDEQGRKFLELRVAANEFQLAHARFDYKANPPRNELQQD